MPATTKKQKELIPAVIYARYSSTNQSEQSITLKIYTRTVTAAEERKLYSSAEKSNKLKQNNSHDIHSSVMAQQNLQDVTTVIAAQMRNREPLVHCAVFIELMALSKEALTELEALILSELSRAKIGVDKLLLRRKRHNQSEYLRGMALNGCIIRVDYSDIRELSRLLKNATNNLNQIAHRANETRNIHEHDIKDLQKNYDTVSRFVGEIKTKLARMG